MKEIDKDELALMIACMAGPQGTETYAEGVYRSAELYEEMTGKKIGLERPREEKVEKKWYQFWKPTV
jgi:hypothetical protein